MTDLLNTIIEGDCLEKLKELPDNTIDAVISDPPYELGFMGKSWDNTGIANNKEMWAECLRVLKPGGHLLAFSGTRTYHRMAVAIEDAGFEVRDMIEWVYGSGFPKSLNIGKSVNQIETNFVTKGTSEWEGWGTALKPAHEPICMARKPLAEKTVAENVLKYGTGGINIDESRVGTETISIHNAPKGTFAGGEPDRGSDTESYRDSIGRFPANLIHDNSEEVRECFPEQKSGARSSKHDIGNEDGEMFNHGIYGKYKAKNYDDAPAESGNASRFFKSIIYQAKASKSERNRGCEGLEEKVGVRQGLAGEHKDTASTNSHPTVKPIALMEYLVKLVSREGAVVLDPFAGSGTTLVAAKELGRNYIGIEKEPEYVEIAKKRLNG